MCPHSMSVVIILLSLTGARPFRRVQPNVCDIGGGALGPAAAVQEDQAHRHQGDGHRRGLGARGARVGRARVAGGAGEAAHAARGLQDLPGEALHSRYLISL